MSKPKKTDDSNFRQAFGYTHEKSKSLLFKLRHNQKLKVVIALAMILAFAWFLGSLVGMYV